MFGKKNLVLAAHPDDEMLGCGGTLARLRASGASVSILLLGEGPTSRCGSDTSGIEFVQSDSRLAAQKAAEVLGITDVRFLNLPDNRFDELPLLNVVQAIEKAIVDIAPDTVLTHFSGDLNIDHQITCRAASTAFRPLPGEKPVTLLGFEVLSSTEYTPPYVGVAFQPSLYVDISDYLPLKQEALRAYAEEMRDWPHPRSYEAVEHLARLRGCHCGVAAAEAFVVYRHII